MIEYLEIVRDKLNEIEATDRDKIIFLAEKFADTVEKDGLIYIFGCGHSHMAAEECFYRAGGLANVYPIFSEELMLHQGAVTSSRLERMNGRAVQFLEKYNFSKKDIFIVVSVSGINGVPVQAAQEAKRRGAYTVGITSRAYDEEKSRAEGGVHLYECCDLVFDNRCPKGDAGIRAGNTVCAPLSTITVTAILESIVSEAVGKMIARGIEPPVFVSGNIEGGAEKNLRLIKRYEKRVSCLK
ncbi:MAG: SIS domain-containing protein [Candidatus Borkfalkiaceae bacterium]|nr:SIS domain-containing protein [Clostridia bacterium]MDY6223878.1 SIS domain-containing protein [Christensenellaceae bacterium]